MALPQTLIYYILWHYTKAWSDMMRIIGNYLWFVGNFFSINLLLQTLLSPWRRLSVSSGRHGEEGFFGALIINTLMRFVGFFIRLFTIIIGSVSLLGTMFLGFVLALAWLALPLIVFFLFFAGLGYLFGAI